MAKKSKIYKVPVSFDIYVVATNKREAKEIAEKNMCEEFNQMSYDVLDKPQRLYNIKQVEKNIRETLPWGDDSAETIKERLK